MPLFLPSSVSLSYIILVVPLRECFGKHSCMSSPFPIAILNCIICGPSRETCGIAAERSNITIYHILYYRLCLELLELIGGGWMICHFSIVQVHFAFCQSNFILLFPFLMKYYHILFIIIVFRLVSDKLSPVSSSVFPKGSVTGCDSSSGGGWMICHFSNI